MSSEKDGDRRNVSAEEMRRILTARPNAQVIRSVPGLWKKLLPFFLSFALLLLFLGGVLVLLTPANALRIWTSSDSGVPARDLLTGYLRWYQALFGLSAAALVVNVLLGLFQLWKGICSLRTYRRIGKPVRENVVTRLKLWEYAGRLGAVPPEFTPEEAEASRNAVAQAEPYATAGAFLLLGVLLCALTAGFFLAMGTAEHLAELPGQAKADLAQLEAGTLEEAVVWISPKCRPARLPGPYSKDQPQLTMRYGVIGPDTGGQWVRVYVPNALGFSLAGERLYDENQNVAWNLEHAQRYLVRYTTQLHVVERVTPLRPATGTK